VLQLDGDFLGTAGADVITIAGTIAGNGGFSLGDGNDRMEFNGGPAPTCVSDGGAGGDDTLAFRGVALDDGTFAGLQGWERMSLETGSTLTLSTAMTGVGTLALDATAALFRARRCVACRCVVERWRDAPGRSTIVDRRRLRRRSERDPARHGVPGSNTAGGLAIAGNVTGTTPVVFSSDGSTGGARNSILVIDSPNDVRGDGGFTVSDSPDATLRLEGSPYAWSFGRPTTTVGISTAPRRKRCRKWCRK
jgi:hypothetical protein